MNEAKINTYVPPEYVSIPKAQFDEMADEIERLRARIAELEAAEALRHGSMGKPAQSETISISFTWNLPPNTPGNELP